MPGDSNYLAHFTKGGDACANLVSILQEQVIRAGRLPWTNRPAVCFTECPWSSLLNHARNYSPYGVGFGKHHVFAAGGGPAYYVRADHFNAQRWAEEVYPFITPFWPGYRPDNLRTDDHLGGRTVDYAHEREWRVPHNFTFDRNRTAFVILDTYEDMARFPTDLKDDIGRDNFILMDVYRKIEELWPTHVL
ncbi:MAG: abortive infection system antitoxin AbiGi family protein [Rhodothermales bacterium]